VPAGCATAGPCPGGPQPIYDPSTNTVSFSYGSASIGQTYAVNQALASVGAGVKINGYTYSYVWGGTTTTSNNYFPMAGRNYLLSVKIDLK
jgi:hypothetical protein